ncbi:hypothetical protein F5B19DRAFT_449558 [Rostrohypoxylon terebratum]|nr:hypothetical protein F5B19DRAFT_449558 [Rostrohypoxylon terebratum]
MAGLEGWAGSFLLETFHAVRIIYLLLCTLLVGRCLTSDRQAINQQHHVLFARLAFLASYEQTVSQTTGYFKKTKKTYRPADMQEEDARHVQYNFRYATQCQLVLSCSACPARPARPLQPAPDRQSRRMLGNMVISVKGSCLSGIFNITQTFPEIRDFFPVFPLFQDSPKPRRVTLDA